jgi:hypothetical protein
MQTIRVRCDLLEKVGTLFPNDSRVSLHGSL